MGKNNEGKNVLTVTVLAQKRYRRLLKMLPDWGIKYLTLYTFSTENWNRPQDEIAALMNLLLESIEEETLMKNNIRFNVIGDFKKLPVEVQKSLTSCIKRTSKNSGMYMVLALSYSSVGK